MLYVYSKDDYITVKFPLYIEKSLGVTYSRLIWQF